MRLAVGADVGVSVAVAVGLLVCVGVLVGWAMAVGSGVEVGNSVEVGNGVEVRAATAVGADIVVGSVPQAVKNIQPMKAINRKYFTHPPSFLASPFTPVPPLQTLLSTRPICCSMPSMLSSNLLTTISQLAGSER